jgi:hypothetical protein
MMHLKSIFYHLPREDEIKYEKFCPDGCERDTGGDQAYHLLCGIVGIFKNWNSSLQKSAMRTYVYAVYSHNTEYSHRYCRGMH